MKKVNTQRAITPTVEKTELRFICSARCLKVFNIYVKFHENMSSGFKVMEQTRKLLTDTERARARERERERERERWKTNDIPPAYTPMAYFVCRGYNYLRCML